VWLLASTSAIACPEGFLAVFDVSHDVLDHHDGVIDHESDGERLSKLNPSRYITMNVCE
jgi:hypothetical protein